MKSINKMVALVALIFCLTSLSSYAQTKESKKRDCCLMKDGKMMCMKEGKLMPMDKDMVLKNGTKCMVNGECVMKDGSKMNMKNGDCLDMDGKTCVGITKADSKTKATVKKVAYGCPMCKDVTSDKAGKCPKCGMDLVKK